MALSTRIANYALCGATAPGFGFVIPAISQPESTTVPTPIRIRGGGGAHSPAAQPLFHLLIGAGFTTFHRESTKYLRVSKKSLHTSNPVSAARRAISVSRYLKELSV